MAKRVRVIAKTRARGAVGGLASQGSGKKPHRVKARARRSGKGTVGLRRPLGGRGRRSRPRGRIETASACVAALRIAEHVGRETDEVVQEYEVGLSPQAVGGRGAKRGRAERGLRRCCEAMAAMGHVQRGKIMLKLLDGPATYRTLQRATSLAAGPLYHHVSQLRMAGLILPKQRDLYEMTRGGRNLVMAAILLGPMVCDRRRRPLGVSV